MAQSTANPDFTFEVGKSYRTYDKKSSVTITRRSACYVSGVEENGETFRRKILKYAATYEYNGDGKVFECFILHEHVHVSARDEAQPEITAKAEITPDNNPLHHLKPCPNCRSTHIPFLKLCNSNNFSYVRCTDGEVWQHIYYRLKCRDCGHEVTATVYRTGLGHVIPHQNEADVKKEVFQAWNKQYDDNPGFTVVPSEHIEKPAYTVYPEHIIDQCPYVTVYACETPTLTHAAVVPYAEAAPIRKIFRLIAIFLRLWLAMHPTPSLQPLDDFPDGLFTHYPTRNAPRKKFNRAVFEVGYSYSASCYSPSNGLQSFSFLVTGRVAYTDTEDKRKGVFLFVTCNSPDDHDFEGRGIVCVHTEHGVEIYNHNQYYEMGYGWRVFSFRADKRDNVPYPFKDTTPSEPNYKPCGDCTRFISREFLNYSDAVQNVPAEINDITPQPKPQQKTRNHEHTQKTHKPESASDSEHKLIDTANLHFQERRAALDHNAAVISSCMFHEAVISMLLKISPATIIQLGFHMGLFIAKPKGKKIVIAESFAKRLINRRDFHAVKSASVHTHTAQHTSNNTAGIPDNVKFFEAKHRQLAFVFTDELVFTD